VEIKVSHLLLSEKIFRQGLEFPKQLHPILDSIVFKLNFKRRPEFKKKKLTNFFLQTKSRFRAFAKLREVAVSFKVCHPRCVCN